MKQEGMLVVWLRSVNFDSESCLGYPGKMPRVTSEEIQRNEVYFNFCIFHTFRGQGNEMGEADVQ